MLSFSLKIPDLKWIVPHHWKIHFIRMTIPVSLPFCAYSATWRCTKLKKRQCFYNYTQQAKENELQTQDKRWCVLKPLSIFLFTDVLKCKEILHYTHNIPLFAFIQKYCCLFLNLTVRLYHIYLWLWVPQQWKETHRSAPRGLNSRGKSVGCYGHMFPVHPESLETISNLVSFRNMVPFIVLTATHGCFSTF